VRAGVNTHFTGNVQEADVILAGAITAAVLLAPLERKAFGADEHLAQLETTNAVAKQLVREPAVAGCFIRKTRPNCHA